MRVTLLCLLLALAGVTIPSFAKAQLEPPLPPTCQLLHAGDTGEPSIQTALSSCPPGKAVELAPGANPGNFAFHTGPIQLRAGVSLIVDGGVTVYGSTNAGDYQEPGQEGPKGGVCGQVGENPIYGTCKALITLSSDNGIYGDGVIDGQGESPVTVQGATIPSWWYLITDDKSGCRQSSATAPDATCEEASPPIISTGTEPAKNIVLDGITLRNPPFHTVRLVGAGIVVSNVKVQAPWNVPNTDGFDISGSNFLINDSVVANGDQDVAFSSSKTATSNVLINHFRAYGKGGIALLTSGPGYNNIAVNDFAMTGDVPSAHFGSGPYKTEGASVNGVSDASMLAEHGVHFYQALPSFDGQSKGLQVLTSATSAGRIVKNVVFNNVCIQDIDLPLNINPALDQSAVPDAAGTGTSVPKQIGPLVFRNMTVSAPSQQFVAFKSSESGETVWKPGKFGFNMLYDGGPRNQIVLDNFVFGNGQTPEALFDALNVKGNLIAAVNNVYPALFNHMENPNSPWGFQDNKYFSRAADTLPSRAYSCNAGMFPFLTADLYAGTRTSSHVTTASAALGSTLTLYAVVQPVMSQTSYLLGNHSLYAIGSPRLAGLVSFFDNGVYIGNAALRANGSLATLTINSIGGGKHAFTARYQDPANAEIYKPYAFGNVKIAVKN